MFKRVLATVLTILMLLSVIPATLVSALSPLPSVSVQPTYYLDDNNGVRWYYFGMEGWYFQSGNGLFVNYSNQISDYLNLRTGIAQPTRGTIYVFSTDASYGLAEYTTEKGWEMTASAGGFPGQGGGAAMSSYTLTDNNGATWMYTGGTWAYVLNPFWGMTGSLSDYYATYGSYPESGTIKDKTGAVYSYAVFNTTTYTWTLSNNGGFGQMTSGYTIYDGRATWSSMFNEWVFVATLANGQRITGDAEDYYAQFGEYPTTGTATDAQGNFVSYCVFDETTKSWGYSAGPNAGTNTFEYIIDNNNMRWVYTAGAWYYLKSNNTYGSVSEYVAAYNRYPVSGKAYTAQNTFVADCSFNFQTYSWITKASDIYIVDNWGVHWIQTDAGWRYVQSNGSFADVDSYFTVYKKYPTAGQSYNSNGDMIGAWSFNSSTGTWTAISNLPGTGLNSTYYILDNNNVVWYFRNYAWYFQTNLTSTGYGGAAEYQATYYTYPMSGTMYSADNTTMGLYLFNTNTYTWEAVGSSIIPGGSTPSNPDSIIPDAYYSGQLADPNRAQKVYDTNNRLWTKSGATWTSQHSSYYTVANPARYIDSTNRVWEMRNSRWVLNENAKPNAGEVVVPPTTGMYNPNNLTTLTDTKGYVWNKSGSVWTSNASSYYSVLNVTPEYKAEDNSIWGLNSSRTTWTKTSGGTQTPPSDPSTPVIPESVAGYTAYVFDGKTYQVPNHTIEIVPGPTTLPYKPEGYSWITYNGQYTLMNLNTGDIYPVPVLYQLPSNYFYQPTYDKDNPWKIVGNGTFANSTITSIELTDYPYKLEVGKTYQCKAEFKSENNEEGLSTIMIWSSTNPDVAVVDQTGKVTIVGVGRADIKVRSFLGFVETRMDIYGIEPEVVPEQPVTPPDEPEIPPVVTTPVSDIFTDVSANAPYTEYIQYVYDNEIFKGMSETTFGPESTMTRAQFYTVLSRMAGYTDAELKAKYPSTKFADSQDKWFTAAVEWAYSEGLDGGVGAMQITDANGQLVWVENCFNPDGAIKREDACAALYNFAIKYHHVYFGQPYNISFADASAVNWWAQPAVSSFSQLGILSGHIIDNGNFRPQDPATRSDIATIIARYAKLYME